MNVPTGRQGPNQVVYGWSGKQISRAGEGKGSLRLGAQVLYILRPIGTLGSEVSRCTETLDLSETTIHLPQVLPRTPFKMAIKSVQSLVEDIRLVSETNYEIVEAVRVLIKKTFKSTSEEVKYGGILFSSAVQFCGVFAYKEHVSVEFRAGSKITDDIGLLEGAGKGRRHLKLKSVAEVKSKKLAVYLSLAHKAASEV